MKVKRPTATELAYALYVIKAAELIVTAYVERREIPASHIAEFYNALDDLHDTMFGNFDVRIADMLETPLYDEAATYIEDPQTRVEPESGE